MGVDIEHFQKLMQLIANLDEQIKEMQSQTIMSSKAILEIADQTGGKGWTEAVQNAVANLDNRVHKLSEIAAAHQQTFEDIAEAQSLLEMVEGKDTKDLN